jgi:DNA invertase Pin-like site-specific DNA recombinase
VILHNAQYSSFQISLSRAICCFVVLLCRNFNQYYSSRNFEISSGGGYAKLPLFKYAQLHKLQIDEFIQLEISSRKNRQARRIDDLMQRLSDGDTLIVAELSRLGRNMFEVISIINDLSEKGVKVVFVRQPELSTAGPHRKLLLAIYSYFAEAERDFISVRTKQGLAAAKASGKKLGRPKGSRNKQRALDPFHKQIREYLQLNIPLRRISRIINPQLENGLAYSSYQYFVQQDDELLALWQAQRQG